MAERQLLEVAQVVGQVPGQRATHADDVVVGHRDHQHEARRRGAAGPDRLAHSSTWVASTTTRRSGMRKNSEAWVLRRCIQANPRRRSPS